jgi:hypothetical protein
MIGKTSIGRSFKGCCGYNLQKVEMGKGEILLSQGVRDYELGAMVADFVRQAQMNPDLSRSVWHTAVSFDPKDEARLRADPQLMQQVASEYLKGMGLDQSQYVVIRHTDTAHAHFHIVANRVANDGQTVSDSHNFSRSETLLRQIEQQYQLTPMKEQAQRMSLENLPDRDRSRIEIRDQVRESLSRSTSGQELREDLARHHIAMIVNRDGAGQPRGISFERVKAQENGEAIKVAFKGSKLHQNLGMGQIQQQLSLNAQLRQKHAIEIDKEKERVKGIKPEIAPQIEEKQLKRGYGRRM